MRPLITIATISLMLCASLACASEGVPPLKSLRYKGVVGWAWVPEAEAFDAQGKLVEHWFGTHAEMLQRNIRANSAGGCNTYLVEPAVHHAPPEASLTEVTARARSIIVGKAIGSTRGFFHAFPGTLVTFEVSEQIRGHHSEQVLYVFVAVAEFITPEGAICSRFLTDFDVPAVGDTVVAFSFYDANDEAGLIVTLDPERHMVVGRDDALLHVPLSMASEFQNLSSSEALSRVRDAARKAN